MLTCGCRFAVGSRSETGTHVPIEFSWPARCAQTCTVSCGQAVRADVLYLTSNGCDHTASSLGSEVVCAWPRLAGRGNGSWSTGTWRYVWNGMHGQAIHQHDLCIPR